MASGRILVTGGTGSLGSEIVKTLTKTSNYETTALDLNPPALGIEAYPGVRYVRANILQPEELAKVLQEAKPDIVIHTVGVFPIGAARYSQQGREAVFDVNVQGTKNVIQAAKECGAKGLVYTSSITVIADEIDKDFKNADETWPTGSAWLSYGQSKVRHLHS